MARNRGQDEATADAVNPSELEGALARIPSVGAARVVVDRGRITEVHVLAGTDRSPKQIVRDVQSVALTTFGVEVDYRTVSVVQLESPRVEPTGDPTPVPARQEPAEQEPAPAERTEAASAPEVPAAPPSEPARAQLPQLEQAAQARSEGQAEEHRANGHVPRGGQAQAGSPRPMLIKVGSEVVGHATEVRVAIGVPGGEVVGTARGPASTGPLLVCRAVADGLAGLLGEAAIDVDVSRFVSIGANELAVCVLRTATRDGDVTVSGSALVRRDPNDAMARATLAALNRLLSRQAHATEPA